MSTTTSGSHAVPAGEPKPIIPPLASLYSHTRDLSWLVVRITAGGMLLVHNPCLERLRPPTKSFTHYLKRKSGGPVV